MTRKKISQNQGDSGRVNLSGSELQQFNAEIGDEIRVNVAENKEIAKAMIDSHPEKTEFIIVTKTPDTGNADTDTQHE